ncbi:hypothetical protein IID62_07490 [candidate division KSB1 bacterium]|nr:hypothetical protein [candidate division KSB1 bacterium]
MNTILKIIEKRGGMDSLKEAGHIKVESGSYMPLSIDYLGKGPNGFDMISVAHNYIQNGDVMADPDMQVEVAQGLKELELHPVTFQQDGLGLYQEVYEMKDGKVTGIRLRLKADLRKFLRTWGTNLRRQGFLAAA